MRWYSTRCLCRPAVSSAKEGEGWRQVTSELAFERSGPERFLSSFQLLVELARRAGPDPEAQIAGAVGRMVAHLKTLRRMSLSIAGMLPAGETPNLEAALVKDLGNAFERKIPELARLVAPSSGHAGNDRFEQVLAETTLHARPGPCAAARPRSCAASSPAASGCGDRGERCRARAWAFVYCPGHPRPGLLHTRHPCVPSPGSQQIDLFGPLSRHPPS